MNEFNFRQFVSQHKNDSVKELTQIIGTPEGRNISDHFAECLQIGISVLEDNFDLDEEELAVYQAAGGALAIISAEGDIGDIAMAQMAISSKAVRNMFKLMMIYGIGLSVKEELR